MNEHTQPTPFVSDEALDTVFGGRGRVLQRQASEAMRALPTDVQLEIRRRRGRSVHALTGLTLMFHALLGTPGDVDLPTAPQDTDTQDAGTPNRQPSVCASHVKSCLGLVSVPGSLARQHREEKRP